MLYDDVNQQQCPINSTTVSILHVSLSLTHTQGFLEVNTMNGNIGVTTPEEKHVVNMQINGYENPTYKYFETKE